MHLQSLNECFVGKHHGTPLLIIGMRLHCRP
jgi:hypothetical protein